MPLPYRQTPRSVRIRARSRNRILRAARRLLARNGLEGTTMNQIASDANTSIGNLYFYFKNKDALLEAVVMAELASHGRKVDRRLEGIAAGPLATAVGMYSYLESLFREPEITEIIVVGERHPSIRQAFTENIVARIHDRLPEEVRNGRGGEVQMSSIAEMSSVFALVSAHLGGTLDVSPDAFFRFTTGIRLRIYRLAPEAEWKVIRETEHRIGWKEGRTWQELRR